MQKTTCRICGGEYNNTDKNGIQYFHACPDITEKNGNSTPRPNKIDENLDTKETLKGREIMKQYLEKKAKENII